MVKNTEILHFGLIGAFAEWQFVILLPNLVYYIQ